MGKNYHWFSYYIRYSIQTILFFFIFVSLTGLLFAESAFYYDAVKELQQGNYDNAVPLLKKFIETSNDEVLTKKAYLKLLNCFIKTNDKINFYNYKKNAVSRFLNDSDFITQINNINMAETIAKKKFATPKAEITAQDTVSEQIELKPAVELIKSKSKKEDGLRAFQNKNYYIALKYLLEYKKDNDIDNSVNYNIAVIYYKLKNYILAANYLKEYIKFNNNDTDAKLLLAQSFIKTNNNNEAKIYLEEILKKDANNSNAKMMLEKINLVESESSLKNDTEWITELEHNYANENALPITDLEKYRGFEPFDVSSENIYDYSLVSEIEKENRDKRDSSVKRIEVSIKGSVKYPGKYNIKNSKNYIYLIDVAGGLKPESDNYLILHKKDEDIKIALDRLFKKDYVNLPEIEENDEIIIPEKIKLIITGLINQTIEISSAKELRLNDLIEKGVLKLERGNIYRLNIRLPDERSITKYSNEVIDLPSNSIVEIDYAYSDIFLELNNLEKIKFKLKENFKIRDIIKKLDLKNYKIRKIYNRNMILNDDYVLQPEDKIKIEFQKYKISGAVKNPGEYYLTENLKIENAIDIAGGYLKSAAKRIYIIRTVNNEKIKLKVSIDTKIFDSDEIIVSKNFFKKIF